MKLTKIRIRNFRCFKDEITLDIDQLTAIIGKNDAGKSSILEALDIWFNDKNPDSGDATNVGNKADLCIVCEFTDLPSNLVIDANYPTTLEDEFLLNEHGRLEIHKIYSGDLKAPKLKETFAIANHPTANSYSDLLSLKNQDLKKRAAELGVDITGIDPKINSQVRKAIWNSAPDLEVNEAKVSLDDEEGKKAFESLKKYLPVYALFKSDRPSTDQDSEAQDPMKAAVKEALKAKQPELDALADHVRSQVQEIADATISKLRELDPNLANKLEPRFPSPSWDSAFKITLADDQDVPMNKRGSGVRRLVLLSFFRAKAEQRVKEVDSGSVIYAVEEPETSQHPNSQRLLVRAFQELASLSGCQVILTTHTPTFARLLPISSLRYLECPYGEPRAIFQRDDATAAKIVKALGVLPDHDIKVFIGVEGPNDIEFLNRISTRLISDGVVVPNLPQLEEEGHLMYIPLGGSNLGVWIGRLKSLNRPEFHLFDRDAPAGQPPKYQSKADEMVASGATVMITQKLEMENYLHADAISEGIAVTVAVTDFDDIPMLVAEAVHTNSGSPTPWATVNDEGKSEKESRAKRKLNRECVDKMNSARLKERDPDDELIGWLNKISDLMMS